MKPVLSFLVLMFLFSPAVMAQEPPHAVPDSMAARADVGEPGPVFQRGAQELDAAGFVAVVMEDANVVWADLFATWGHAYVPPRYVAVEAGNYAMSNCGINAGNPSDHTSFSPIFYCPYGGALGTQVYASSGMLETARTFEPVIYVSLSWLEERFAGNGRDAALGVAYLMTRQVAIHVQDQLGYLDYRGGGWGDTSDAQVELWADCLAGVWAFSAYDTGTLAGADVEMAQTTAWGDAESFPEQFGRGGDHGSAEDQLAFFMTGYTSGNPAACLAMEVGS